MSKYPAIPDFTRTFESMEPALRALKESTEIITGHRQGESLGAPSIFVQATEPLVAQRPSYKIGDLWIDTRVDKMNYWSGKEWRRLG